MQQEIQMSNKAGSAERKRGFKWWWAWEPEKVEKYLEDMSRRGWRVTSVSGSCMGFRFERAEPENVRFCVDYPSQATEEYKTIFTDAGWSLRYESLGWFLWSKAYAPGEARPEIYTDRESLIARNRNMLIFSAALLMLQASVPGAMVRLVENFGAVMIPVAVLYGVFYLSLVYGVIRLSIGMVMMGRGKKG